MKKQMENVTVECIKGDIASQSDIDAVVNAANAELRTGGGVAGALHRAAGPGLEKECRPLAPIKPGEAVITGGHLLPNPYVIHCLGPVYGVDQPEKELLASCYRQALKLADENELSSIAFPAISTGAFGYPADEALDVVFETVSALIPKLTSVKLVRFVLYSQSDLELYKKAMERIG